MQRVVRISSSVSIQAAAYQHATSVMATIIVATGRTKVTAVSCISIHYVRNIDFQTAIVVKLIHQMFP